MFGQMTVEPVVQVDPGVDLLIAVAALTKVKARVLKNLAAQSHLSIRMPFIASFLQGSDSGVFRFVC